LLNISLGSCVPKYAWQSLMIFISAVLNNFIVKRLKVKSSDLTSDRVNGTDSKPYNNTGIHFEKQVAILLRRLQSNQPCQKWHSLNEKNDFLWLVYFLWWCRRCDGREGQPGQAVAGGRRGTALHGSWKPGPGDHVQSGHSDEEGQVRRRMPVAGDPTGLE